MNTTPINPSVTTFYDFMLAMGFWQWMGFLFVVFFTLAVFNTLFKSMGKAFTRPPVIHGGQHVHGDIKKG